MNTRLGKSFGLAFVVAVGILALMLALGTFNAQKVGAQAVGVGSITIDSATPAPGAAVQVRVTAKFTDAVDNFGEFTIELEGYGLPASIDVKDVLIRTGKDLQSLNEAGNPSNVTVSVSDNVITIELEGNGKDDDSDPGVEIKAEDLAQITIRQRAGITAPALAGNYDVSVGDQTEADAVTVSPSLSLKPTKGGSSTQIAVSGKAFANGTGSLYTETLVNPDANNDGIIDTIVEGTDTTPTETDNKGWGLSVDGGDGADFDLLRVKVTDGKDYYAAVPVGHKLVDLEGTDANVEDLGYTISLAPDTPNDVTAPPKNTPTIPSATYRNEKFLKDVAVDDGAFSTTIEAAGLNGGDEGRSSIRITDADGIDARATFQVTGTVALGSDSIRKGTLLKISLSDWIGELPTEVTIGGVTVADDGDPGYDGSAATLAGETLFRDNDGNQIPPPAEDDLDDGAFDFYVKVLSGVRLGSKTVVLFDRDAEGEQRLNSANVEITASGLTVSPSSAVTGQEITVEGRGFSTDGDGQLASITVGGIPQTELSNNENVGDYDVLSGGRVVLTFVVPAEVTKGDRTIQVIDDSGRVGEVALTVPEPTITLNPQESRRGTTVNVSGTGFPASESVTVDYGDNSDVAVGRSDGSGNWSANFRVPSSAEIGGSVDVEASATVDDGNDEGDADTTYSADTKHSVPDKAIDVTPEQVQIGDAVEIVGTGFPRYGDVEIKFAGGEFRSTSARTDENGDFTHSATVPGLDAGTHVLQIRVNDAGASFVLDVVDTPISTIKASADAFADLVTADNLIVVWYFDNTSKDWFFYDPRPAVAGAVDLLTVSTGDNVWIQITADQMFQGEMLTAGWNLVTLD